MVTSAVFRLALFVVVTAVILRVSWASLRRPGSHGFPRVFAWEAILALVLLNLDDWFDDPFGLRQMISWLCLTLSLFLVLHGAWLLRRVGKPDRARHDATLLPLERTTALVTVGAYRYIRHPLYCSLLLLAWGAFLKAPSWLGGGLGVVATACLIATARAEEAENLRFFGPAYGAYMRRTKRFIPFVF